MKENMVLFNNKEDCCGCSACYNICPQNAISMVPDDLGFLYPQIDNEKCIRCGLCKTVCLYNKNYNTVEDCLEKAKVYAVKHNDLQIRKRSQSGGIFVALSDFILENNGIVYGVGFDDDFTAIHKRAMSKNERDEFCGSKYIQSRIDKIYHFVKKDLDNNYLVMFTGTPCQVEGLKKYLGNHKNLDKLFLVDLICYSVASAKLWKEYLNFLSNKYDDGITSVKFRDKSFGWHSCIETIQFYRKVRSFDYFAQIFFSKLSARESCFNCKFTNLKRCSDITIGDYWGIEKYVPDFEDNDGVSIVFLNSEKGKMLFNNIKDCECVEVPLEYSLQPAITVKQEMPCQRQLFLNDYNNNGIKTVLKKYAGYSFKDRIKSKLKQFVIVRYIWNKYKHL